MTTFGELDEAIGVIGRAATGNNRPTTATLLSHRWEQVLRILKFARDTRMPSVFGRVAGSEREGVIQAIADAREHGWSRKDVVSLVCAVYSVSRQFNEGDLARWVEAGRVENWHRDGFKWDLGEFGEVRRDEN